MNHKFKPGQIAYCQGEWKCKVVRQNGPALEYIPLDGYPANWKGKTVSAAADLFTHKRIKPCG